MHVSHKTSPKAESRGVRVLISWSGVEGCVFPLVAVVYVDCPLPFSDQH